MLFPFPGGNIVIKYPLLVVVLADHVQVESVGVEPVTDAGVDEPEPAAKILGAVPTRVGVGVGVGGAERMITPIRRDRAVNSGASLPPTIPDPVVRWAVLD